LRPQHFLPCTPIRLENILLRQWPGGHRANTGGVWTTLDTKRVWVPPGRELSVPPTCTRCGSCWAGLENTHVNVQGGLLGRQERLQSAGVLSPTRQLPQGTEAGLEFFAASGGRCPAPHAMSDRRALRSIFTSILFHRRQRCRLKTSRHGVRVSAWHCKSSDASQRAAARCRTWFVTA